MVNRRQSIENQHQSIETKSSKFRPLAFAIALAFSGTASHSAQAATYTVTNGADSGIGSLRKAIEDSNDVTPGQADTINFNLIPGLTIDIQTELVITDSVTITGPTAGDASSITLDALGTSRHISANFPFASEGNSITLENITLRNGKTTGDGELGGAIEVNSADLILNHSHVLASSTSGDYSPGGGIYVFYGNATFTQSTISGNSTSGTNATGGGVYVATGNATLIGSIISGNSTSGTDGRGGGLSVDDGDAILNQSTVSFNSTNGDRSQGGGLYVDDYTTLIQSTVSGNSTIDNNSPGGGLSASDAILTQSTVSNNYTFANDNSSGGGLSVYNVTLNETTLSGNRTFGSLTTGGGLFNRFGGSTTLNQSTVSSNTSGSGLGAGIWTTGNTTIKQSTIAFNNGEGLSVSTNSNSVIITNSILAGNNGATNGNFENRDAGANSTNNIDIAYGVFGDPLSEITGNSLGTVMNNNPVLDDLQHNGGLTQTHNPIFSFSSPVLNAGSNFLTNVFGFENEQRGNSFPRIKDTKVDIGAVEFHHIENGASLALNPDEVVTRRDLARELLKVKLGSLFVPPFADGGSYSDVQVGDVNADWIEEFKTAAFTEGCATQKYCGNMVVTREQMAIVFLKTKYGFDHTPTDMGISFTDVAPASFNASWINDLSGKGFTQGCDTNKFCPKEPVTREWFDSLLSNLP